MDYETLDDSNNSLPVEAIKEIKKMGTWMTFTGVMTIIFVILGLLGNLGSLTRTGQPIFIVSILLNALSLYLGFLMIKKSGLFTAYADTHDENKLVEALKANKTYWMFSTVLIIASFIISFLNQ
jgi:hypothetical protein